MSSQIKSIKVYGGAAPNSPKVAMVLEELSVLHEMDPISLAEINRLPAIHDPSTDLTLCDSGAILMYLVEQYDKDHRLSFPSDSAEDYLTKQWLFFQPSGQGPYYGRAVWFKTYHPEPVTSAVERYVMEANRVTGVVEGHVARESKRYHSASYPEREGGSWLVGNEMTYADVAFLRWQFALQIFYSQDELDPDE